jgi:surfeit locus 1 family protein
MTPPRVRFPVWLTLASAVVFVVCLGLGVWQVQRWQWKQQVLAQIAALKTAPAQPIAPVLARMARGQDVEYTRVAADCAAGPAQAVVFSMGVRDTQYTWRPQSPCRLTAAPYDGVIADRGVLEADNGATKPPPATLPQPGHLVGVLRKPKTLAVGTGLAHPAPLVLVVETETPAAPGVTPEPVASGVPDNLQYVGEYGPTWFGLAGVLACFYAALLWRRYRSK